jgi:hypothetical protein
LPSKKYQFNHMGFPHGFPRILGLPESSGQPAGVLSRLLPAPLSFLGSVAAPSRRTVRRFRTTKLGGDRLD